MLSLTVSILIKKFAVLRVGEYCIRGDRENGNPGDGEECYVRVLSPGHDKTWPLHP